MTSSPETLSEPEASAPPQLTELERNIFQQGINAGYKFGYKHGFQDALRQCDEADREAQDAFTRQAAKSAAAAIDVVAAREKLKRGEAT